MEQPSSPDNIRVQANIAIARQITGKVFTPTEPKDIAWFNNPSYWSISYMTKHKLSGEDLYFEYYKDGARSRRTVPDGLSLPAIMIDVKGTSDTRRHVTSIGIVSTYSTSTGENEYLTTTEYWFDMEGNARRVTHTELMEDEEPGPEVQTVDENITENEESTPLDPGDYELIEGNLAQFRNGEYEEGEYGGDISEE